MNLVNQIKELFETNPSNIEEIKRLLSMRKFTKDELSEMAISFTDNCFCEYLDVMNGHVPSVNIDNMCSSYVVEALRLLLEVGLDPNDNNMQDDENVMWNTMWIDMPNVAAKVMKLLLENGGNPNHFLPGERETLFEYIVFKVSYDEYTHEYIHTVQCWLLLMAYGACWADGDIPLTMLNGNSVDIFKDFELYDFEIEYLPRKPGKYGCWIMHIYNINTKEEVAVYK